MSSHSRQCFHCTRQNVESVSTALSAVPGLMFRQSRQRLPLYRVQCRVSLDSAFLSTRPNVESFSAVLPQYQVQSRVILDSTSNVPGPMSSHSRQRFHCTRPNAESVSTVLPNVPDPTSSKSRQRFPLYQVQCRVSLDSPFRCTKPNVELKSTHYITLLYPSFLVSAFEL
jgi:hypothetical protein